jgi:hypothetical protein
MYPLIWEMTIFVTIRPCDDDDAVSSIELIQIYEERHRRQRHEDYESMMLYLP